MKFNVSSTALYYRLQAISRVISSKNSIAILDCFLLELKEGKLHLTASDSETTLCTTLEVNDVEGDLRVAIPMKTLLDGLKEISEQPLSMEINPANFEITVSYLNGKYTLMGQQAEEYPLPKAIDSEAVSLNLPIGTLLEGVNTCAFAAGDDELRKVMSGIYFDIETEHLTLVATDGHKLVRLKLNSIQAGEKAAFILPKKPAGLLKALLIKEEAEAEGSVSISFDDKQASFSFGTSRMVCRLIEGRFPNYNAVIPQNSPHTILIDRLAFLGALKRVAIFSSTSNSQVKLSFDTNNVTISTKDIDFSTAAEEKLACEYSGGKLEIGFKSAFLIDILNNIATDNVEIGLADPSRAGIIVPTEQNEGEDLLTLLMPMMINY
ncbi:MAG: DNA polymerase III subunit beta [Phocaeicola sp.]|nr:DNA polymerase III subunit beta [Phocaeicola sp.]MDD7448997.1 DNA polymerase III subunit beta [Prevotellaceae bacterium]MDY5938959.1 DNA polymerase III subunit beta [Phocaeicola sp.]